MAKQCKACGNDFHPHPKVPNQTYCSSPECQRERRRRWLEQKRQVDADYHGNEPQKIEQWRCFDIVREKMRTSGRYFVRRFVR